MKSIVRGIKNIFKWLPVIWYDRDWDNYFIEVILYNKMVNTYNFFISDDSVTNWEEREVQKALKALHICIVILDRRLNNYYLHLNPKSLEDSEKILEMEKRDLQLFGKLVGKYLSHWWD